MDFILDYVKSFLVLFFILKVLLYMVPQNGFYRYISFFAGVILVIGMIGPVLHLTGMDETLLDKIQSESWEQKMSELSLQTNDFREESLLRYEKIMEEMIESMNAEGE